MTSRTAFHSLRALFLLSVVQYGASIIACFSNSFLLFNCAIDITRFIIAEFMIAKFIIAELIIDILYKQVINQYILNLAMMD